MSGPLDLGLFPLDLVALPGEPVPLLLFEPRYRQLYADCVLEDRPFVIVQAGPSGTVTVGCSLRFTTLVRRFADGRLSVVATGEEPVELIDETEGHLYFSATVRPLADDEVVPEPGLADGVLGRYRELAGIAEGVRPGEAEGVPLSYGIAASVEIPSAAKQELLESRDENERLRMVRALLATADRDAQHARLAARRAQTNGKVSHP